MSVEPWTPGKGWPRDLQCRSLGQQRNAHVTATVGPLLDEALTAVAEGSDDALKRLTELAQTYAGQPLFCTVDEFDLWMADADSVLVHCTL